MCVAVISVVAVRRCSLLFVVRCCCLLCGVLLVVCPLLSLVGFGCGSWLLVVVRCSLLVVCCNCFVVR